MKRLRKQVLQAIAYAQDFLTFLFLDAAVNGHIHAVYLYGSAVRGALEKESDIDLFIDCAPLHEKEVQGVANAALSRFYASHDAEKWGLLKFSFPISVQAGALASWSLKESITAEGIVLFSTRIESGKNKRQVLFCFTHLKKKKDYIRIIRLLFGRNEKNYRDNGLLGKLKGERISSTVILVPQESQQEMLAFMQYHKLDFSMKEFMALGA